MNDRLFDWLESSPKHRTWFALGWTITFFAIVLVLVQPTYKVTDNTGILSMIQSGAETPFISQVLSSTLTVLYRIHGGIPWYGLANFAALFWAMALFVHALSSIPRARPVFVPIVVVFSAVFTMFLIRCGYNASSILLSGISMLAFATYVREARATKLAVLACALGLAFGLVFRPRGMQGATLIVAPAILAFAWCARNRFTLPLLIAFLAPVGVVATTHFTWKAVGVSDEYREFRDFNRLRGKFHSYPIQKANKDNNRLFRINGWHKFHYLLLKDWFYVDEDIWTIERLRNVFTYSVPLPEDTLSYEVFEDAVTVLLEHFWAFPFLLPLLGVLGFALTSRRTLKWSAGYLLFLLILSLYLRIALRLPIRIGDPMFTLAFASMLWIMLADAPRITWQERMAKPALRFGFLAAWLVAVGGFSWKDYEDARLYRKRNATYEKHIANFNRWFEGKTLFIQPAILKSHDQSPLRSYEYTYDAVPLGWRIRSPQFYDFLRERGLERGAELFPWAIDNEDCYFLWARGRIGALILLARYQYGKLLKIKSYEGLSSSRYLVCQFVTDPKPPRDSSIYHSDGIATPFDLPERKDKVTPGTTRVQFQVRGD